MTNITVDIVKQLIHNQFPQWDTLEIYPVEKSGHDNRTFHLGNNMTIRLPSSLEYVAQVEKELKWLPILQQAISIPISSPLAKGEPETCYPFPWSINCFIEGETVNHNNIDKQTLACELDSFLKELQAIDITDAPVAGQHNFYRGGDLHVYDAQTQAALIELKDTLPIEKLNHIWQLALSTQWINRAVWIHGDIAPGNLLVRNNHLCGVIDFGIMGVGDPACDYAMAWTFFDSDTRKEFLKSLDDETINRARGWALWKALITYNSQDKEVSNNARITIQSILEESNE
ncbi:MAG: aminoglycoside phosphotransferase family protein [Coprobacillus sp.]